MEPRQRYGLIDFDGLRELFNFRSISELTNTYRGWVEESMSENAVLRLKTLISGTFIAKFKWLTWPDPEPRTFSRASFGFAFSLVMGYPPEQI